jgi:hypothetical protein
VARDVGSIGQKHWNHAQAWLIASQAFRDTVGQVTQAPGSPARPRSLVERHGATLAVDRASGEIRGLARSFSRLSVVEGGAQPIGITTSASIAIAANSSVRYEIEYL